MAEDKAFLEAEVRQKIIDALRKDLVGPSEENEVLDESPMFEYLTGMLYPKELSECPELEQEVAEDVDHDDKDSNYTPKSEDDESEPMAATKFKQQSTIGMSFYVAKSLQHLKMQVSWGEYFASKEKYGTVNNEERVRTVYTRTPMKDVVDVDLTAFDKSCDFPLRVDSHIHIFVSKLKLNNDYMLVTAHVTNKRSNGESPLDSIIFQVKLEAWSDESKETFVAENCCRNILSADEFYFAQRPIFGRGRGCALMWDQVSDIFASKVYTSFIPEYEFAGVRASIEGFNEDHFLMSFMAKASKRNETVGRLEQLNNAYVDWIRETLEKSPRMQDEAFKRDVGDDVIGKCRDASRRILEGIDILKNNDLAFDAFCFMNKVMTMQRSIAGYSKKHGKGITCSFRDFCDPSKKENQFCWRPFQIAFILMNLKSIVSPESSDREVVDLLYFPTGGGKTEAYLGLIAFTIAYRRLTNNESDEFNRDGGVTVILRYTLRLLTTQQRDRLLKMVIAAEMERRNAPDKYGKTPISIGFFVGGGVTPNNFDQLDESKNENAQHYKNLLYKQILTCPFCGKKLSHENFQIDLESKSVKIYCDDKHCLHYKYGNGTTSLMPVPVYLVDEEIYQRCPTVILATVDKFAVLPWKPEANALFGRVDRKCPRHGFVAMGAKHSSHQATAELSATKLSSIKPFAPPELIVQDELHLITGPLGTIYGAYETMIEDLCTYEKNGVRIRPKYVASTATIRNAMDQIRCLYGRTKSMQFPANGFEIGDSFFIKEIPTDEKPFRKYVGISAIGQSMKTTTLRTYAIILQTVNELKNDPKYSEYFDPYYTLIGYFNSIRELGGTVRLLQDDIPKRLNRLTRKYGFKAPRYLNRRIEITSRISSSKIAESLNKLEVDSKSKECLDTAIATNMIAVGMDVDRLGLMTVMGQPKQNSEYIQATSRIGRQHPGVVFTMYNPYRPRDLSHYENFVGYHSQLYRYVEGTTATPYSARARDRVLHALIIAAIRLKLPQYADNLDARKIPSLTSEEKSLVINTILERLAIVNPNARKDAAREIEIFIGDWKMLAAQRQPLTYYVGANLLNRYQRLMNFYGEISSPTEKPTLNSMREVESSAALYYYEED